MADCGNNLLDYVNYDFDDLLVQLTDRVKSRDAWQDTYRSSTGQMLIELLAYVANLVLYYVERRAEESYLGTAQLRSSVVNIVRLLNYQPKRKTSATGVLKFSLDAPATKKVFIPQYTQVTSTAGRSYLVAQDAVINVGQTEVEVNGIQGALIESEQRSAGGADQEYTINDDSVEDGNLFILVNGEEWTEVTSFIASTGSDQHYQLLSELDGTLRVLFGDDQFGDAPDDGDTILFRYIRSDGGDGNVYELDRITAIVDTIFNEDSEQVGNISVTNSDLFLGGDDEEDIEEIRFEAPRVFATGDRAVTRSDYIAILENLAGVANANVWGENEEDPPNSELFNRVKLVVILQNWQLPSDSFKQTITDALFDKSMITVRYSFVDAEFIQVIPVIDIVALSGQTLSQVQSDVESALDGLFTLGTTTRLGTNKYLSDVIAVLEAVTGVDHFTMYFDIRKVLIEAFDSFGEWGEILDLYPIKPETARVFVNDTQVATDDGAGGWTSETSAYTVTGSIDYTTGLVHVNFAPDLGSGDEVYIRYQQDSDGDLELNERNHILRLHDTEVPSIVYAT